MDNKKKGSLFRSILFGTFLISCIIFAYYYSILSADASGKVPPVKSTYTNSETKNKLEVGDLQIAVIANGFSDTLYYVESFQRDYDSDDPTPYYKWVRLSPNYNSIQEAKPFLDSLLRKKMFEEMEQKKKFTKVGSVPVGSLTAAVPH